MAIIRLKERKERGDGDGRPRGEGKAERQSRGERISVGDRVRARGREREEARHLAPGAPEVLWAWMAQPSKVQEVWEATSHPLWSPMGSAPGQTWGVRGAALPW